MKDITPTDLVFLLDDPDTIGVVLTHPIDAHPLSRGLIFVKWITGTRQGYSSFERVGSLEVLSSSVKK